MEQGAAEELPEADGVTGGEGVGGPWPRLVPEGGLAGGEGVALAEDGNVPRTAGDEEEVAQVGDEDQPEGVEVLGDLRGKADGEDVVAGSLGFEDAAGGELAAGGIGEVGAFGELVGG